MTPLQGFAHHGVTPSALDEFLLPDAVEEEARSPQGAGRVRPPRHPVHLCVLNAVHVDRSLYNDSSVVNALHSVGSA